jgi:hypothetical protein
MCVERHHSSSVSLEILCIDPLLLDCFEQTLARTREGFNVRWAILTKGLKISGLVQLEVLFH